MAYIVYKIVNNINQKYYIGKHKTSNPLDTYMGSGKLIRAALKKYGKHNFQKHIIAEFKTDEEASSLEKYLISISDEFSYNLHEGGNGGFSFINSINKNVRFGKRDISTKIKMKTNHWSKTDKREEIIEKYSSKQRGKTISLETRKKMSITKKELFKSKEHMKKHALANSKSIVVDGVLFSSSKEAAKFYNITPQAVYYRLKSLNYPEWNYKNV